ncbi:MAG TPA: ATP-binding protein [Burkholderiaceae bacterium]
MRIRSRLLSLVFAILIPSLLCAGLGVYYVYREQQKSYEKSIADLARATALLLDKEMSARARTLQALAASPTLTNSDLRTFYEYARGTTSGWETAVIVSDLQGNQLLNTRSAYGAGALPAMDAGLMAQRRARGPQAVLISDIYFAKLGGDHSFAVQVPVMRGGQPLYYLAIGSFTSQLMALLAEQKLPADWIVSIVDRNKVIAARTHETDKYIGRSASPMMQQAIAGKAEGSLQSTTLNGMPVTAFFSRAPVSGWTIIVSVPRAETRAPAIRATAIISAVTLLLLGLGAAGALTVARKTAKPMEDLRLAAAELGQGKAVARSSSGVLEIDAVSLEIARASEQIRNAKAELEQRVAEAVGAAERSQKALLQSQKLEALGRLTGGIAHDFNNVMQTLSTGMQYLLMSVPDARQKKTVEACQRAVARASELTKQLLAFGRVQDANLQTMHPARHLEEIRPLLHGALRSDTELRIEVFEPVWPVTIDPAQFELAMLNVVINARDAMPRGGQVGIRVRSVSFDSASSELAAGNYVHIAVADTGEGMSLDVLTKALEPFFTTTPVGQGTGLGLAQAYGFAKQADGALTIESEPGAGTTIHFYLPRADGAVTSAATKPQPYAAAAVRSGIRVLFVEDDPLVAAVVGPALAAAGFDVTDAANGAAALSEMARNGPFDVVFSDIVMPGQLSGIELAEQISRQDQPTRVILATGYSQQRLHLDGVEILAKPYDVDDLIALLNQPLPPRP